MRISRRLRACAAALAVATLILAASGAHADEEGTRDADTHVLIGVTPQTAFGIIADGETIPDSPATSDELGIVEFTVDLPPGTHTVSLSPSGSLPDPPVMSDLHTEEITTTSAVIRWETDVPTNARVVYGLTAEYGNDTGFTPVYVTSHAVPLTGLDPNTEYHYRVQGKDVSGQSVWSGDMTFVTAQEPLVITDVEVSLVGPTWVVIEWSTNRPSTSQVEYGITASYGEETPESGNPVLEHSVTLSGLLDGTEYHFRAVSRDVDEMVAQSSDDTFTTLEVEPTGPPTIGDVTFVSESINSVVIMWTTDREATSCVCYGTKGILDHATSMDTTAVTDHMVRVRPVAPDHLYTFVVLSACGADTAQSDEFTFMAESPIGTENVGKSVTIFRPGAMCVSETTATIVWATDRPCSTWIEYGDDDNWDTPAFPDGGRGECHETSLTGLEPGTTYYFRVCAWDEFGGSVEEDGGTFETGSVPDHTPPDVPEELVAIPTTYGVELSWDECTGEDLEGYYVYRLEAKRQSGVFDVGRATRLNELPLAEPSYFDGSAYEHVSYVYAVSAVDGCGNESSPSEGIVAMMVPEGNGGSWSGVYLAIGLNPCYGSTTLEYAAPENANVGMRIYSVSGRLIRDLSSATHPKDGGSVTWDCRDEVNRPVGTGVFVCELTAGEDVVRKKLTVLR